MKLIKTILFATLIFALGCEGHPVDYPPDAPINLFSITGDSEITIYWDHNSETDVDKYAVYSSNKEFGTYVLEGTTYDDWYSVPLSNGVTRYFAVAALDFAGNESELSYATIWDTPRPEGSGFVVYALFYDEAQTNFNSCGVDFSDYNSGMLQSLENSSNDIYVDNFEGVLYLNTFEDDTDLAMFGYSEYISDVDYVNPDNTDWIEEGYVELVEDFSYIIWTWDNHFAVVRVQEVLYDRVVLEWAYQTDTGNPQLKVSGTQERTLKIRTKKSVK